MQINIEVERLLMHKFIIEAPIEIATSSFNPQRAKTLPIQTNMEFRLDIKMAHLHCKGTFTT